MENKELTRQQLYELVWSKPVSSVAEEYNVTDYALRKVCKKLKIPLPRAGYWVKIRYGKAVRREPLPADFQGDENVFNYIREETATAQRAKTPFDLLVEEIESDPKLPLKVPERLVNPDPLIIQAKNSLTRKDRWLQDGLVRTEWDLLRTQVAPSSVHRALLFMDSLIKLVRARHHQVKSGHSNTYLVVDGVEFKTRLREYKKIVPSDDRWSTRKYQPTGKLCFLHDHWDKKEWKDGRLKIEDQLSHILAYFELKAQEEKERERQWEIERRKEEEKERKEKILRKRKQKEISDFKSLLKLVKRWHRAQDLRQYLDLVESHAAQNSSLDQDLQSWLNWARMKADWYDPLINAKDDLLGEFDAKSLKEKQESRPVRLWGW